MEKNCIVEWDGVKKIHAFSLGNIICNLCQEKKVCNNTLISMSYSPWQTMQARVEKFVFIKHFFFFPLSISTPSPAAGEMSVLDWRWDRKSAWKHGSWWNGGRGQVSFSEKFCHSYIMCVCVCNNWWARNFCYIFYCIFLVCK